MEESQFTLYRPLAFYPFSMSGAVQTEINFGALQSENKNLTCSIPFCNETKTLIFQSLEQCHVVQQLDCDTSQSQTTLVPDFSAQDYSAKQIHSPWNLVSTLHHKSHNWESNLIVNSSEDSKDSVAVGASNRQKGSKIWRPFSPELDCASSSNATYSDILREGKDTTHEVPSFRSFPTILPSTVRIGESSVFKAVKKKKYQCRYCDQWYLNSGQLAGHIRAHIGSKPYRCEYQGCLRAFARNEELTRHRRIHSGVKPHQCETCQKRFGRKDHLNKHKKTHMKASEKKIYLCEVLGCKHRYTRSDALTRHLSTAHSIKHQKPNGGKIRQNLYQIPSAIQ